MRKARGMESQPPRSRRRGELERFISLHCGKLHGLLVEDVIHHSGTGLPYHVAATVAARQQTFGAHEAQSPLRDAWTGGCPIAILPCSGAQARATSPTSGPAWARGRRHGAPAMVS